MITFVIIIGVVLFVIPAVKTALEKVLPKEEYWTVNVHRTEAFASPKCINEYMSKRHPRLYGRRRINKPCIRLDKGSAFPWRSPFIGDYVEGPFGIEVLDMRKGRFIKACHECDKEFISTGGRRAHTKRTGHKTYCTNDRLIEPQ